MSEKCFYIDDEMVQKTLGTGSDREIEVSRESQTFIVKTLGNNRRYVEVEHNRAHDADVRASLGNLTVDLGESRLVVYYRIREKQKNNTLLVENCNHTNVEKDERLSDLLCNYILPVIEHIAQKENLTVSYPNWLKDNILANNTKGIGAAAKTDSAKGIIRR